MLSFLANIFTSIISQAGYGGIAFLMALESMIAPVPSEAVMPFAGFLIFEGKMSWTLAIGASLIGSLIGSLLSYAIGFYWGRSAIIKYGKYLFLNEKHLAWTENFFQKTGDKAIFISRFIPVVRHLISIPAGAGKMNLFKFSAYTALGAGIWNALLTYGGFYLKNNWDIIKRGGEIADIGIIILIIVLIYYFIKKSRSRS